MRRLLSWALIPLLLSGCYSVDVAESSGLDDRTVAHVCVSNYGWSLFGCVPIVCGNANEDSWCPFAFFRNDITADSAQKKLEAVAERFDAEPTDTFLLDDNDVLFDAYYCQVPWVVVYKEVNVSANLRKRGGAQ